MKWLSSPRGDRGRLQFISLEIFKGVSPDWLKPEMLTMTFYVFLPGQRDSMISWNYLLVQCCKCLLKQLQKVIICGMCAHARVQFAHPGPTSQCPLDCLSEEGQRAWVLGKRCSEPGLVRICSLLLSVWICSYKIRNSFSISHSPPFYRFRIKKRAKMRWVR